MSAAQTIPHEDRGTYLGSHDTSAIFGLNPWKSPVDVYMRKTGMIDDDEEQTERMTMGMKIQPIILDLFADRFGCKLEGERFIRHPEMPWFGGTPDATIIGRKAGVDAKNIQFNRGEWGDEGSDTVPEYVAMQCHHFMALMDYERWYVAALFGGCEFKIYEIERDEEIVGMIVKADAEFWNNHVALEIPPELDASVSWRKYVERRFPRDNGDVREATEEETVILAEYKAAKTLRKLWEAKEEEATNRLCKSLGETAGITCDLGRVSYKTHKGRSSIDVKRLREEMPDMAKKYEKIGTEGRTLRITLKEEE